MKERPFGVSLIAVLIIIEAIFQIIAALAMMGISMIGFFATPYIGASVALTVFGVIAIIVGLIQLAVGSGMWSLEKWAWIFAVVVLWIDVIFDILGGFAGVQSWGAALVSMIIPVIVLIYLYSEGVRKAFGR